MENSLQARSGKGYDVKQNTDGTIDICFRQQILDPAMTGIVVLPVLFFTSCSGIFGVSNTFGMPGGIITSIVLIAAIFIAGYFGVGFFNSKEAEIKIIPGQRIEFGRHALNKSAIEKIGVQAGSMGANRFKVFALAGGEKIFITEFIPSATAKAIQDGIQEFLNRTQPVWVVPVPS